MLKADDYIRSLGLEAYRVGGSVRDELIGRTPKDADYVVFGADLSELTTAVATSGGKPSPLKLRDGRQIGVRANVRGLGLVEVALPRTEVSTGPTRHDFKIVVDPDLTFEDDAKRRDFTINTLYRDVRDGKIIDPTGTGFDAIRERVLITTHPDSFRDDPLRILRAGRFVARGFSVSSETYAQMREHADAVSGLTVKGVSGTAFDELCKLLMGKYVGNGLRVLRDTGALAVLLPEVEWMLGFEQESRYHDMTTDEHTFVALEAAAGMHCNLRVRMALLFHDSGKPYVAWKGDDDRLHYYANPNADPGDPSGMDHEVASAGQAATALARLNAPKSLRQDVDVLIRRHMVSLTGKTKPAKVRRWRVEIGDELLTDLLKHRLCDCLGKGEIDNSQLVAIERLERIHEEAKRAHVPASVKELKVDGHDAKALGLRGKQIGEVLRSILHEVVSQPNARSMSREWQIERLATKASTL